MRLIILCATLQGAFSIGKSPSARIGSGLTSTPDGMIYLFGGNDDSGEILTLTRSIIGLQCTKLSASTLLKIRCRLLPLPLTFAHRIQIKLKSRICPESAFVCSNDFAQPLILSDTTFNGKKPSFPHYPVLGQFSSTTSTATIPPTRAGPCSPLPERRPRPAQEWASPRRRQGRSTSLAE